MKHVKVQQQSVVRVDRCEDDGRQLLSYRQSVSTQYH